MVVETIRAATIHDLSTLNTIEAASFHSDQVSPRQMRYLLSKAKATTFVFELDESVVAYALVLTPVPPKPARLYSIAVSETFRGKKIAARLMEFLLKYSEEQGYESIRLEVRVSQNDAKALYDRFGFVVMKRLQSYYQDGEDAYRMEKKLS